MKNKDTAKEIVNSLTVFGVNMPHAALFLIEGILDKSYGKGKFKTGNSKVQIIEQSYRTRFNDDLIDD